jgi:hypothetical protein
MTWTNDWRGKPCQWVEVIDVPAEHVQYVSADDWQALGDYYERARAAMERCQAAFQALHDDTSNSYVIRVEPECVQECKDKQHRIIIRGRVHWCESETEAMKFVNLEEEWNALT